MSKQSLTFALLLTAFLPVSPLVAQTSNAMTKPSAADLRHYADLSGIQANLSVGDQVKLSMDGPGPSEMKGILMGMDGSDFLVSPDGGSMVVRVESSQVWRVQVPVGERRQTMKGAGYGAGGGALLGVALGLGSGDDPEGCWIMCMTAGEKAFIGGAFLGLTGGVIGMIAGAFSKETVWGDVTPRSFRPSILPSPTGGVEFRLSLPTRR